jgi:hypothetical protein
MQTTMTATHGNRTKMAQVEAAMAELLAESLRRGFYGKVVLELSLADGTIQHIRRVVERIEK